MTALVAQQVSTRRLQLKLRRVEQERALERERTRIARDIHDDLGARLTKIGMLTAQAERQALSAGPPPPQLREIALTAREMVQAMDATVWAVNPRNDTFDHLANYLVQYVQEFFRYSHVVCRLDLPTELPDWPVSAEVRHNVFLVVKEALNNVARHADASEVRLELQLDELNPAHRRPRQWTWLQSRQTAPTRKRIAEHGATPPTIGRTPAGRERARGRRLHHVGTEVARAKCREGRLMEMPCSILSLGTLRLDGQWTTT